MTGEWQRLAFVTSADGTPIGVHPVGNGPPLVLVHGVAADHTTFRVIGPLLATRWTVHAIDRRGRGDSGDTSPYAIEREFEDVAAVAEELAQRAGGPVDVFGHSYGGRCALGAALRTEAIRRLVSYEGAPTPPGVSYQDEDLVARLSTMAGEGDGDRLLGTFMTEVVGMSADDLAAYRADQVWPRRVAAAPTIVRELEAERSPGAALEALGAVRRPVLQVLGGASLETFAAATRALDARLSDGRIVTIPGARHAAHHTHPDALVEALNAFFGV